MTFIVLEGIEGSGKSTQMGHIARHLEAVGREYLLTREPGGTTIGEKIRAILLDPDHHFLSPKAELFLYAADRLQHLETVIRPALDAGRIVVCDRFADCTTAYQGYGRGLDLELIHQVHALVLGKMAPDLIFLLDLPAEVGLARAWRALDQGARQGNESRFEQEALDFHQKVRQGYLALARRDPARYVIVDAAADEAVVRARILDVLRARLGAG